MRYMHLVFSRKNIKSYSFLTFRIIEHLMKKKDFFSKSTISCNKDYTRNLHA